MRSTAASELRQYSHVNRLTGFSLGLVHICVRARAEFGLGTEPSLQELGVSVKQHSPLPSLVQNGIDIYSLTVDSQVSSRFAHTVVTSRVVNRADTAQEATFQLELPRKAFITNFSM